MLRSVLGVATGVVVTIVVGMAGMAVLLVATYGMPLGMEPVTPGWAFLAANLAAMALAGVAAGLVTASIARRRPLMHALVVVVILAALAAPTVRPRPREPVWFAHALVVFALAGVVAGGALQGTRTPRRAVTGSPRA